MDAQSRKSIIAGCKSIVIYSGNILLKLLATSEEVCHSFCGTLEKWIHCGECVSHQKTPDQLYLSCEENAIDVNTVNELKLLMKVFLLEINPDAVEHAVKNVIEELKCQKVDSLIVSLPKSDLDCKSTFQAVPYEKIKDTWEMMEALVNQGLVEQLGVCDFDANSLQELYTNAKIKPVKNQINLVNCCTPPDDLTAFARDKNISLTTHNDQKEILSQETQKQILNFLHNGGNWHASYLARYSTVIRLREIVKSKGYFLCLQKT